MSQIENDAPEEAQDLSPKETNGSDGPCPKLKFRAFLLLVLNLLLGVTVFANVESRMNSLEGLVIWVFGLLSWWICAAWKVSTWDRVLGLYPSIIGGTLVLVSCGAPGHFLASAFRADERNKETVLQRSRSPDGTRDAIAVIQPVGAYMGGEGVFVIRIEYRFLPSAERRIYERKVYANEWDDLKANVRKRISWKDDDHVLLLGDDLAIETGSLPWGWLLLMLPFVLHRMSCRWLHFRYARQEVEQSSS